MRLTSDRQADAADVDLREIDQAGVARTMAIHPGAVGLMFHLDVDVAGLLVGMP
jgi:hypothetical protein